MPRSESDHPEDTQPTEGTDASFGEDDETTRGLRWAIHSAYYSSMNRILDETAKNLGSKRVALLAWFERIDSESPQEK